MINFSSRKTSFNKFKRGPCLAMETTGVYKGAEGFKKDKRGEKLAETEEDRLEYRTDGTDAFDTLYIGCTKFPQIITSYNLTSTFVQ